MPRLKSYWNAKANALMTTDQRKASDERYATWQHQRDLNSKARWNSLSIERARQWALEHPEEARTRRAAARKARKARRMADPEYAAKCKAKKKQHREKHYSKYPTAKKAERLKSKGWTLERYDTTLQEQNNRCAICRETFIATPHADHKHIEPPLPRGLLCNYCNSLIGFAKESPDRCEAAAKYLRHWNKPCNNCGMCLDCLREECS
jgi:hypothetical protein